MGKVGEDEGEKEKDTFSADRERRPPPPDVSVEEVLSSPVKAARSVKQEDGLGEEEWSEWDEDTLAWLEAEGALGSVAVMGATQAIAPDSVLSHLDLGRSDLLGLPSQVRTEVLKEAEAHRVALRAQIDEHEASARQFSALQLQGLLAQGDLSRKIRRAKDEGRRQREAQVPSALLNQSWCHSGLTSLGRHSARLF